MFNICDCKVIMKKCPYCDEVKSIFKFRKRKYSYSLKCKRCSNKRKGKYEKICLYCEKHFLGDRITTKYCSRTCKDEHQKIILKNKNNPNYKGTHKVKCSGCSKIIEIIEHDYTKYKKHYCSNECKRNSVQCKCIICGDNFIVDNYRYNKNKNSFCSKTCANKFHSKNMKGVLNPRFNHDLTEQERITKRCYTEYNTFIKSVYLRDNYTCQITHKRGGDLVVHHLNGYNWDKKHRTDIDNGITLSKRIHKLFHDNYGYKNNTKKQFEEFKIRYIKGDFNIKL